MHRAVIVRAKRTPFGQKNGMLESMQPQELASPLLADLASGFEPELDDVILGNVVGPGGNIARFSALEAGLPLTLPGMTLDRQCSAGLEAIRTACYWIQGHAGSCYIAGGIESASTSPYTKRAQFAPESIGDTDMGIGAENVARNFDISRQMQDEYTLMSYKRSWNAYHKGLTRDEIIPILHMNQDEAFLKRRNIERLVDRAKPIFLNGGTVTAVNSCGIHDGGSAVLVMEETMAKSYGLTPALRFAGSAVSGVHPNSPGIAPVYAIRKILAQHNLSIADIDLFEINEAFASKIAACAKELHIPYEKLNVNGGALTVGHPYAASGSALVTRLFYEAKRNKNYTYVIAAIGSAGGIGVAVLFEVIN
ncbi:acetyl-CoA acetyltransferase [Virgibacillus phasianinus]|uniref:Acetyl-CoA acetyltransferase n=1 Tax=Virgibacillus phasianinus TaxID=2017483 RepID=A0A220U442_9BACI|nr:acetyl-CoA C-acyltransferase [Virgibacillus phasianinus]ASK62686.1 acetyl-CoA acetyltransferase [Virgibacillus phasianinus]